MTSGPAPSPLEVRVGARRWLADPRRRLVIGRDDDVDVRLVEPQVSRRHVVLEPTPAGWLLTDASSNGTWVAGRRVTRMPLTGPVVAVLGVPPDGIEVHLAPVHAPPSQPFPAPAPASQPFLPPAPPFPAPAPASQPFPAPAPASQPVLPPAPPSQPVPAQPAPGRLTAVHEIARNRITVGRLPDNDVVLNDLLVSRRHAELHRTAAGWELVDLRSDNGTYLNGRRVDRAPVRAGDVIGVGHGQLHLVGDRLEAYLDTGDIGFSAADLVVTTEDGRRILDRVGFALPERSLLAVVGPSGSGKSTLLNALTGFRPATSGTVDYGGRDLYAEYDELRNRIGLVPQDDILHSQLTVRRALSFAAELRFPQDVPRADRERRVDEVLAELSLAQHADKRITSLSGGQRKRTSVALELLTKPSLLFLDEPTSGLDPGMDKSVMQTLRGLADDGRTVVVVTHAMTNVRLCDRLLILGRGGQLAFFGPPDEALAYFGQEDFAEIFLLLDEESAVDWGARYRASPYHQKYVVAPAQRRPPPRPAPRGPHQLEVGPRQQSPARQFGILCRRYLAVIASDRQFTVLLCALPLLLGLSTLLVPGGSGLSSAAAAAGGAAGSAADRAQPTYVLLLLIIAGLLMGSFQSLRELVKEREVYRRERAIGLSMTAYLASKVVVLGVLLGVQGVVLGLLGTAWHDPPDDALVLGAPRAEVVVAVVLVTLASMLVGLVISAMVDNADRATPLVVLVVMLQIILSGGIFPVDGPVIGQLAWLSPSRWAFAMGAATVDLNPLKPESDRDGLWDHDAATWVGALLALLLLMAALTALMWVLLRRFDPQRRSGVAAGAPPVGFAGTQRMAAPHRPGPPRPVPPSRGYGPPGPPHPPAPGLPGAGRPVTGAGRQVPGTGPRVPGTGPRVPGTGPRVPGTGPAAPGAPGQAPPVPPPPTTTP